MQLQCTCAIGLVAAAGCAADTVDMFVFENADNADVAGLVLTVDVAADGDDVQFVFKNESTIDGFITAIYVEETAFTDNALENGELGDVVGDVAFWEPATPPNPPGAISGFGGSWGGNIFSADHLSAQGNLFAIHAGESLAVEFDLDGVDFADVIDALGDPALFRFAAHVQGLEDDASVWAVSQPMQVVPLPPAAVAGAGMLGLMAGARFLRRR